MMALWEPGEDGSRSYNDATEVFGSKAGEIEIKNEIFDRTKTARPCSLVAVPWVFEPLWVSLIFLRRREGSPHHLLWCWLWTFRLCELSCRKDEGSSGARELYTQASSRDWHIQGLDCHFRTMSISRDGFPEKHTVPSIPIFIAPLTRNLGPFSTSRWTYGCRVDSSESSRRSCDSKVSSFRQRWEQKTILRFLGVFFFVVSEDERSVRRLERWTEELSLYLNVQTPSHLKRERGFGWCVQLQPQHNHTFVQSILPTLFMREDGPCFSSRPMALKKSHLGRHTSMCCNFAALVHRLMHRQSPGFWTGHCHQSRRFLGRPWFQFRTILTIMSLTLNFFETPRLRFQDALNRYASSCAIFQWIMNDRIEDFWMEENDRHRTIAIFSGAFDGMRKKLCLKKGN